MLRRALLLAFRSLSAQVTESDFSRLQLHASDSLGLRKSFDMFFFNYDSLQYVGIRPGSVYGALLDLELILGEHI